VRSNGKAAAVVDLLALLRKNGVSAGALAAVIAIGAVTKYRVEAMEARQDKHESEERIEREKLRTEDASLKEEQHRFELALTGMAGDLKATRDSMLKVERYLERAVVRPAGGSLR
jgi:hypothetical protein